MLAVFYEKRFRKEENFQLEEIVNYINPRVLDVVHWVI